jgi:salicylate hydroxylase
LHRLGLDGALDAVAVRPTHVEQRRWADGALLATMPLGDALADVFGAPYLHVHRADLIDVLRTAVPSEWVHVGRRVVRVVDDGARVALSFDDGTSTDADVVIGADGIRSVVRAAVGAEDRPRFSGNVAYRGLLPAEAVADLPVGHTSSLWMGPRGHLVHYFLRRGALFNVVAIVADQTWTDESWTVPGDPAALAAAFAGWDPLVRTILGRLTTVFRWALHDRDPLPMWTRGRVTLLGDACHPMLPYMAQGGAQAIEDAACLAACLRGGDDPSSALARYESLRRDRTARVQLGARRNETVYHLPDGPEQQARDAALAEPTLDPWARVHWLYGHDAAAVDAG